MASDAEWQYEEGIYSLEELCYKHPPPVVVQCDIENSKITSGNVLFDLSQPILLYRQRNINKVTAKNVQRELYREAGPPLLIPEDYKGWFAVLQKKQINPSTLKRDILEFKLVSDLSNSDTETFLIGGTEQVHALQVTQYCDGKYQHQERNLFPGEVLRRGKIYVGETRRRSGIFRRPKLKQEYYLLCTDECDREILLPFQQKGLFYTLTTENSRMSCPVLHIKDILDRKFLPATVKLLFGRTPPNASNFTGMLRLEQSHFERSVIACTTSDRNYFVELPINCHLKFRIYEMNDAVVSSNTYKRAFSMCNEKAHLYMRNIKVCHELDTTKINSEEGTEMDLPPSPHILRKRKQNDETENDNRESGYIEMRDSLEFTEESTYIDMKDSQSLTSDLTMDEEDYVLPTGRNTIHDSLRRGQSNGRGKHLVITRHQSYHSPPPTCLPPPLPSACYGTLNRTYLKLECNTSNEEITKSAGNSDDDRITKVQEDRIYDIPRIPRRLSAPESIDMYTTHKVVPLNNSTVQEEAVKYENFSILREVVPIPCRKSENSPQRKVFEPSDYDFPQNISAEISENNDNVNNSNGKQESTEKHNCSSVLSTHTNIDLTCSTKPTKDNAMCNTPDFVQHSVEFELFDDEKKINAVDNFHQKHEYNEMEYKSNEDNLNESNVLRGVGVLSNSEHTTKQQILGLDDKTTIKSDKNAEEMRIGNTENRCPNRNSKTLVVMDEAYISDNGNQVTISNENTTMTDIGDSQKSENYMGGEAEILNNVKTYVKDNIRNSVAKQDSHSLGTDLEPINTNEPETISIENNQLCMNTSTAVPVKQEIGCVPKHDEENDDILVPNEVCAPNGFDTVSLEETESGTSNLEHPYESDIFQHDLDSLNSLDDILPPPTCMGAFLYDNVNVKQVNSHVNIQTNSAEISHNATGVNYDSNEKTDGSITVKGEINDFDNVCYYTEEINVSEKNAAIDLPIDDFKDKSIPSNTCQTYIDKVECQEKLDFSCNSMKIVNDQDRNGATLTEKIGPLEATESILSFNEKVSRSLMTTTLGISTSYDGDLSDKNTENTKENEFTADYEIPIDDNDSCQAESIFQDTNVTATSFKYKGTDQNAVVNPSYFDTNTNKESCNIGINSNRVNQESFQVVCNINKYSGNKEDFPTKCENDMEGETLDISSVETQTQSFNNDESELLTNTLPEGAIQTALIDNDFKTNHDKFENNTSELNAKVVSEAGKPTYVESEVCEFRTITNYTNTHLKMVSEAGTPASDESDECELCTTTNHINTPPKVVFEAGTPADVESEPREVITTTNYTNTHSKEVSEAGTPANAEPEPCEVRTTTNYTNRHPEVVSVSGTTVNNKSNVYELHTTTSHTQPEVINNHTLVINTPSDIAYENMPSESTCTIQKSDSNLETFPVNTTFKVSDNSTTDSSFVSIAVEDDEQISTDDIITAFKKLGIKKTVTDIVQKHNLKGSNLKDLQKLEQIFPGISCIDKRKISMFLQGMMQTPDSSSHTCHDSLEPTWV